MVSKQKALWIHPNSRFYDNIVFEAIQFPNHSTQNNKTPRMKLTNPCSSKPNPALRSPWTHPAQPNQVQGEGSGNGEKSGFATTVFYLFTLYYAGWSFEESLLPCLTNSLKEPPLETSELEETWLSVRSRKILSLEWPSLPSTITTRQCGSICEAIDAVA